MQTLFFYQGLEREEIVRLPRAHQARIAEAVRGQRHRQRHVGEGPPQHPVFRPGRLSGEQDRGGRRRRAVRGRSPRPPGRARRQDRRHPGGRSPVPDGEDHRPPGGPGGGAACPPRSKPARAPADEGDAAPKGGFQEASLTDREVDQINDLIHANRAISQEDEFLDLIIEIIYLEKDLARFRSSLDVMMEYHLDQLQKGKFQVPILIVRKVQGPPGVPGRTGRGKDGHPGRLPEDRRQRADARGRPRALQDVLRGGPRRVLRLSQAPRGTRPAPGRRGL